MIERTVYQCEHCKKHRRQPKILFSDELMKNHERICYYNTKNKTCFTCIHNDTRYATNSSGVTKRGNKCKIGQNWRYNNHIEEIEHIEKSELEAIYTEKDFFLFPVTMQVVENCEHWRYMYEVKAGGKVE